MRIFIIGATGFIGKRVVRKLAKKNKIICLVRKTSKIESLKMKNVSFAFGDMLDEDSIINSLDKIDVAIHLATSHFSGNEDKNIRGSKNIISACKKKKVKKIVFVSSMASKRKNLDAYGRAKLEIENMLKNSGIDYIILKPSIVYSEDNLSLIGKSLTSLPFIIPIIGNGDYKINPVYIGDVVDAICSSAQNSQIRKKEYDIAGAENLTFNEIIEICKKRFKIRKINIHIPISLCLLIFRFIPVISVEAARGIKEDTNADIRELKEDLKIKPVNFRDGVKNVTL